MLESADGEEDQDVGTDCADLFFSDSTPQFGTSEMLHPPRWTQQLGRTEKASLPSFLISV